MATMAHEFVIEPLRDYILKGAGSDIGAISHARNPVMTEYIYLTTTIQIESTGLFIYYN